MKKRSSERNKQVKKANIKKGKGKKEEEGKVKKKWMKGGNAANKEEKIHRKRNRGTLRRGQKKVRGEKGRSRNNEKEEGWKSNT